LLSHNTCILYVHIFIHHVAFARHCLVHVPCMPNPARTDPRQQVNETLHGIIQMQRGATTQGRRSRSNAPTRRYEAVANGNNQGRLVLSPTAEYVAGINDLFHATAARTGLSVKIATHLLEEEDANFRTRRSWVHSCCIIPSTITMLQHDEVQTHRSELHRGSRVRGGRAEGRVQGL